jgi:hypothetical protein
VNDDIDDGRIEERSDILKRIRAILAAPEPSREELREKVAREIERYCGDEDIGDGAGKTWAQWKSNFADRILALLPTKVVVCGECASILGIEEPSEFGPVIITEADRTMLHSEEQLPTLHDLRGIVPYARLREALIDAAVRWAVGGWDCWLTETCKCINCKLIRAVRRVVKERKGGKKT